MCKEVLNGLEKRSISPAHISLCRITINYHKLNNKNTKERMNKGTNKKHEERSKGTKEPV
jgi:hypothetical protein